MPVIGFIHLTSIEQTRAYLTAFHRGLEDTGFAEGRNVAIEYRWGQGQNDRLPMLVAELVRRQVSVLVTLESTLTALAAKAATQSIPILFMQGADPVRIGLVSSLSRPDGNLTGINLFLAEVAGKRLQLLRETVPSAKAIAYLRNPTNPIYAESETKRSRMRRALLECAFCGRTQTALTRSTRPLLVSCSRRLISIRERRRLFSHQQQSHRGASGPLCGTCDLWLASGRRTRRSDELWNELSRCLAAGRRLHRRLLKGEKPADLPVQQVTKIELIINLKTARRSGLPFRSERARSRATR